MRFFLRTMAISLALVSPSFAAGTLPFALQQQVDVNGRPVVGCLLNIYQSGTTATPQQIFQDFGLTQALPNPIQCDNTGRLPMFWLADGTVHPRLTDAGGVAIVDVPIMQTLGPSSGGGGGGGAVDPNSVASTGDIKFRATSEILAGWIKLNATTIGSATSGANGRANNDTQNLFVYLWNNCPNTHCPVSTGRGATGLADFGANKTIQLPDMRSRMPFGRDQMEAPSAATRLLATNVTSGGGDGVDTPNATGGEANHVLTVAELAAHNHGVNDPGHSHSITDPGHAHNISATQATATQAPGSAFSYLQVLNNGVSGNNVATDQNVQTGITNANAAGTGITIQNNGSSAAHNTMAPFMLGTWYMKL